MFHKKRAIAIAKQLAPLLRELFPTKTDQERATLLTLFSATHGGRSLESLDDSHIEELIRVLRHYIRLRSRDLGIGSPQIGDDCEGCQEFKVSMAELQTGIQFKRDDQGRLVAPLSMIDRDDASEEATDEIVVMLERAGDAAGRVEQYRKDTGLWAGVMTMSNPEDGSRVGYAPAVEKGGGAQFMLTADQHVLVQEPDGAVHPTGDGVPEGWDIQDHLFETSTEAMIALGQWLDVLDSAR